MTVIHHVDHERFHFLIVDLMGRVHVFQLLTIAKTVTGHQLSKALSQGRIVLQFRSLVGVHRLGEMVDSELVVVLEELSDGDGTVDVDALDAEGDAALDGVEDVSVAVLWDTDVVTCDGVEVVEVSKEAGTADVATPSAAGDVVVEDVVPPVFEVCSGGTLEVELTKGGAFAM
jgi:hypothetical protein